MKPYQKTAIIVGLVAALNTSTALAEPVSVQLTLGSAATQTTIKKTAGGELDFASKGAGSIGLKVSYDLKAPERGEAGFRYGMETMASWHALEATANDADLGLVTLKNNWSGSIHGRAGYDFGIVFPYAILGFGLSDASVGTNGNAPGKMLSMGSSVGLGVETELSGNWTGSLEALSIISPDFTPEGGGGTATARVGELRLGLTGRF